MMNKITKSKRKSSSLGTKSQDKTSRKNHTKKRTKDGKREQDRLSHRAKKKSKHLRIKTMDLNLVVELSKSQNFSPDKKKIAKLLSVGKLLALDK